MPVPRDGDTISPSGCVRLQGRRGVIVRRPAPGTCTWCGGPVTEPRRRTWCSQWCVDAYQATQPDHQREAVRERDGERCQSCGLDCLRMLAALRRWRRILHRRRTLDPLPHMGEALALRGRPCSRRQLSGWMDRRDLWDVDHTVPIWAGGHPYDLRNLRTLCPWCHARETAEGAARRAEHRRGLREASADQVGLFGQEPPGAA